MPALPAVSQKLKGGWQLPLYHEPVTTCQAFSRQGMACLGSIEQTFKLISGRG